MLTQERLKELLHYNSEIGVLTWRVNRCQNAMKGDRAGACAVRGYRQICIDRKNYLEHRIIWLYCYGVMPKQDIDHINGIKNDNRIDNLRECTRQENCWNKGKHYKNKGTPKNVFWISNRRRWHVRFMVGGKVISCGYFTDLSDAVVAAKLKRVELHGEFANHGMEES